MRILLVTRNLPPLVGGMERLNWHMAEELSKSAEVRMIGPEGSAALAPEGVMVREAPLTPLWKFLLHARKLARFEARLWKPDIVLAGSGLTAPIARSAARSCGARTCVYVHGLDVAVRHLAYRVFWLPAIRRADRVIANSSATASLCRAIGVDPARLGIVHPGVDLPPEVPWERVNDAAAACRAATPVAANKDRGTDHSNAFRQRHGLGNRELLLSVGRLSARKGLREFVTLSLPCIVASYPDVMMLIVGDTPHQALRAEAQTPESIQAAADAVGVGENIRFLGKISDDELQSLYRDADVHVFPVREIPDDPEGFGMVAVEAAARGLPTVAFATGGVVDAVAEGRSGHLVAVGDYAGFAHAVLGLLAASRIPAGSCAAFARGFAWNAFGTQLAEQLMPIGCNQENGDDQVTAAAQRRQPHAVLDLPSRRWKACKIERLLRLESMPQPIRMLEVGTGSGGIAHYFASHPALRCEVAAVDVTDNRLAGNGYTFHLVDGVELPFPDAAFDVVITNHVIEHVGEVDAQARHLSEIRRVLSPRGIGYLAVPNRWMVTEPHYRLKFLSWWPRPLRTPYLRLMRRGDRYDCEPLQMRQLERMLDAAGFQYRNVCVEAWRETLEIERPHSLGARVLRATPDALLKALNRVNPTLIYLLS